MCYPNNIEQKIDFVVIREELMRRCASVLGREQVEAMQMETDFARVQDMLQLTDQMRLAQADPMLTFPRGDIHDMREAIARIRIEGLFLDEALSYKKAHNDRAIMNVIKRLPSNISYIEKTYGIFVMNRSLFAQIA